MDTQRRIISLEMSKDSSNYEKPTVFVDELEQTKTSIVQLYLGRFKDWCRSQGVQEWALVATAILARLISATLTIRLAVEMGRGQSGTLSVMFGVLLELASCTFAWFAIVHPHDGIRLAARLTTGILIIGSMVASVSWLSKSVEITNTRLITNSIEFQGAQTERDVVRGRLENLSKIAAGDAKHGYRKRALDTDKKIDEAMADFNALTQKQQALIDSSAQNKLLAPFILASCMLEIIAILALALWKFRDEEHENESLEPDAVCVESECCEQAI